jgi:hypothetical protein
MITSRNGVDLYTLYGFISRFRFAQSVSSHSLVALFYGKSFPVSDHLSISFGFSAFSIALITITAIEPDTVLTTRIAFIYFSHTLPDLDSN